MKVILYDLDHSYAAVVESKSHPLPVRSWRGILA